MHNNIKLKEEALRVAFAEGGGLTQRAAGIVLRKYGREPKGFARGKQNGQFKGRNCLGFKQRAALGIGTFMKHETLTCVRVG